MYQAGQGILIATRACKLGMMEGRPGIQFIWAFPSRLANEALLIPKDIIPMRRCTSRTPGTGRALYMPSSGPACKSHMLTSTRF